VIETRFTLTEAEYIEAQRAYAKASGTMRRLNLFLYGIPIVIIVAFATNPAPSSILRDPRALIPAVIVVVLLLSPWLQTRSWKKRFRLESSNLTDVSVQIDESGYFSSASSQGEARIFWTAFTSYVETTNMLLLIKGFSAQMLPKRALISAQTAELLELIASHLPVLTPKLAKTQGRR
jgi:hypothetical protein